MKSFFKRVALVTSLSLMAMTQVHAANVYYTSAHQAGSPGVWVLTWSGLTGCSVGSFNPPSNGWTLTVDGTPGSSTSLSGWGSGSSGGGTATANVYIAGPAGTLNQVTNTIGLSFTCGTDTIMIDPAPPVVSPVALQTVPTMTEWGMITMSLMLVGLGGLRLRRRTGPRQG